MSVCLIMRKLVFGHGRVFGREEACIWSRACVWLRGSLYLVTDVCLVVRKLIFGPERVFGREEACIWSRACVWSQGSLYLVTSVCLVMRKLVFGLAQGYIWSRHKKNWFSENLRFGLVFTKCNGDWRLATDKKKKLFFSIQFQWMVVVALVYCNGDWLQMKRKLFFQFQCYDGWL